MGGARLLVGGCIAAFAAAIACGGDTVKDGGTGGAGAEAGGTSKGGTGGAPADCTMLEASDCASANHCAPLFRNDEIKPGSGVPPDEVPTDPCCIGCQDPACSQCHSPRFVGCRPKSDCAKSELELCGYFTHSSCE